MPFECHSVIDRLFRITLTPRHGLPSGHLCKENQGIA